MFNFQDFFQNFQIPGLFQDVLKFQDTVETLMNKPKNVHVVTEPQEASS